MKNEDAIKLENNLVNTSRRLTLFIGLLFLLVAYFMRDALDWRLLAALILLSLVIQFAVVEPGVRRTCRNLAGQKKEKK